MSGHSGLMVRNDGRRGMGGDGRWVVRYNGRSGMCYGCRQLVVMRDNRGGKVAVHR